ncbi:MAG: hypothetical protein Q4B21_08150 [Bacteroidia bacterium]|nr:hypothetical protein [Bacteroidia bacterium]
MEKKNLIEIDSSIAISVYGGRDENVAKIVYLLAKCVGAFAKMLYLANKNLQKNIREAFGKEAAFSS